MAFANDQLLHLKPLWNRMLSHPFLIQTRDGTLPDQTFVRWMEQDYLFVQEALPFMAALLVRAPLRQRDSFADAISALRAELRLFEEQAGELGMQLGEAKPAFINHAYQQFLIATALRASYPEAYTVLFVAERAYHDSWKVVKSGISPRSKWLPFVENWAGEQFASYVAFLESELDALADQAGPEGREGMAWYFEITARYEIAFWEMALTGEWWPGVSA
jgi:thiaminase